MLAYIGWRFRPLAGIMVLIELNSNAIQKVLYKVSVPLRGLWFLSEALTAGQRLVLVVSVPLRGLWFLSARPPKENVKSIGTSFRPLAGIMVLIISFEILFCNSSASSFRPLAGIMVLING